MNNEAKFQTSGPISLHKNMELKLDDCKVLQSFTEITAKVTVKPYQSLGYTSSCGCKNSLTDNDNSVS